MGVNLEIRDGSPHYWLSPDISILKEDCNGLDYALDPIDEKVGGPVVFRATVRNTGDTTATNVEVQFWVCDNPSTAFAPGLTGVHPVGPVGGINDGPVNVSNIPGMASRDSACTRQFPSMNGHHCVVARASCNEDMAPAIPSGTNFNPAGEPRTAQRNFEVLLASPLASGMFEMEFSAYNIDPAPRMMTLEVTQGSLDQIKDFLPMLREVYPIPEKLSQPRVLGLLRKPQKTTPASLKRSENLVRVLTPAKNRKQLQLVGQLQQGAAVIHVEHRQGKKLIGGLTVLVLALKR
jgi:hypothetical protein